MRLVIILSVCAIVIEYKGVLLLISACICADLYVILDFMKK